MKKILIAYFSRIGENYIDGEIKILEKGNTEVAAEYIHEAVGGDLFKIEMQQPYSDKYKICLEQVKKDHKSQARPPLVRLPPSLDQYDLIYLGYPCYWGTMPPAVFTFIGACDFNGKTVKLFCTNEGSGLGASVADFKRETQGAIIQDGLAIHGSHVRESRDEIVAWAKKDV